MERSGDGLGEFGGGPGGPGRVTRGRAPRLELRRLILALGLIIPLLGGGCAALDSRHISFTATSCYLKISQNEKDNLVFHERPAAYTLAPIGFAGVLALDLVLLPVTFIHDAIVTVGGAREMDPDRITYARRYRGTVYSLISVR